VITVFRLSLDYAVNGADELNFSLDVPWLGNFQATFLKCNLRDWLSTYFRDTVCIKKLPKFLLVFEKKFIAQHLVYTSCETGPEFCRWTC
jgi:hypothetical protein